MKEKRNYSLTAKERKAKRRAEENNQKWKRGDSGAVQHDVVGVSSESDVPQRANDEKSMAAAQKRSKRTSVIIGCVVGVAVLLIIAALIAPVIMFVVNPYRGYDDVVARFKLSNGMVLEYIIDEDEFDTAATNFIFLANNKFFDNTVFYDAQDSWLRFGGYDDQPRDGSSSVSDYDRTFYRGDSAAYCEKFEAIPTSRFERSTYKFGYRLRADNDGTNENMIRQLGALTFRYDTTSTEFQFYVGERAETVPSDISQLKSTMVGHPLNDSTVSNIQAIYNTGELNVSISSGYRWKPPAPTIKIESVEVYNLDSSKWKNFDFLSYMSDNDSSGVRRYTQWIGRN